jgi:hypothetical protein
MAAVAAEDKYLFIPMIDMPAALEDESNRWYDNDHVPERLSCEGFLSCERFQATPHEPAGWLPEQRWTKYLNVYTVQSLDALRSEGYNLQRDMNGGKGSHWKQARSREQKETGQTSPTRSLRSVWKRRPSPWIRRTSVSLPPPRVIYLVLRDVAPERADDFNAYMDNELVPELIASPGFIACERYEAGERLAPAAAANRNIVQPQYMDVFDVATPEVLTAGAFRALQAAPSAKAKALKDAVTIRGAGIYMQRPSPWMVSFSGR